MRDQIRGFLRRNTSIQHKHILKNIAKEHYISDALL